jgi:F-type H+-transporting ATPase subunit gamma
VQEAKVRQLLPLSATELEKMTDQFEQTSEIDESYPIESYSFEPDMSVIVEEVLPRLVEIQLYQAVLESSASEHSARMIAMKNASESAGDMIYDLNLTYNKARQASITQEIAEIAGGAVALE